MLIRTRLAALGAAALLALSGCGSAEDATSDQTQSTAGASTEALTADSFVSTLSDAQSSAETTHVQIKIGASGQEITAEGDVAVGSDPADTQMAMTMDMGSMGAGGAEMRLVDQVFYMNLGPLTENKFAKIDLSDPNNPLGQSFGDLVGQLDPSKSVEDLEGAITSVEKSGSPETLDGVQAQPYEVVVDSTKIADASGLAGSTGVSLPDELTFTFWVGSDNLPRKLTSDMGESTIEATFTKWGDDVSIEAPPADEISKQDPFGAPAA
ncbi:MAG: hypothetical protein ACR2FL_08905 [Nocardioidaceae bacterium]